MNIRVFGRIALVASIGAWPALADDGLYEDVFDPQSSFIRVLAQGASFAAIDGDRIDALDEGLSPYVNVMPGTVDVVLADISTQLDVAPATHYTVVFEADAEPRILVDAPELSPAKADVSLVNLTARDGVELFVPAANAVAIEAVEADGVGAIALKAPLTLDFQLRADGEMLADVPAVDLRRKAGVTVVLSETGGAYDAVALPTIYKK